MIATGAEKVLLRALACEYPWLEHLPERDRAEFLADVIDVGRISADEAVLDQTIREWKATAEIYADPEVLRELTRPLVDAGI